MKKVLGLGLALAFGVAGMTTATTAHAASMWPTVEARIAGADRYETAANVSKEMAPDGASVVLLASGEGFADSLGAGAAAKWLGAPVLLTQRGSLPKSSTAELKRLKPTEVIIVGGEVSVSATVAQEIDAAVETVNRVAGQNRYETSEKLVQLIQKRHPLPADANLVIASGHNFPDALSVTPLAAARKAPLLLVDGKAPALSSATKQIVDSINPQHIYIVGGTNSVSTRIESTLPADKVKRLAGKDRYDTSAAVMLEIGVTERVVMVSGYAYPDALVGGAYAAHRGLPLLAVDPTCLGSNTREAMRKLDVDKLIIVGGPSSLLDLIAIGRMCVMP